MIRILKTALFLMTLAVPSSAVQRANIYQREGDVSAPLFTFERSVREIGQERVTEVEFRDRKGEIVASEQVVYKEGSVDRFQLIQKQVHERYLMTVTGDEAVFEVEKNGETSHSRSDWTPDTLVVDQIPAYVEAHWEQLMRGQTVSFRLVALSRTRIVDFSLKHTGSTRHQGSPAEMFRIQASSFFVRWFAPEIELVFAPGGKKLLEVRGPLPVKVREDNSWSDLNARLVWQD